jgi:hypothetical protein
MADIQQKELLPTERAGIVVYILMANRGKLFTTAYFAQRVSLNHGSAWKMLCKLSRKIPIVQEIDGWVIY